MLVHVDGIRFKQKPTGQDIGGIKSRFTNPKSIQDLNAAQIADALANGQTVQPAITPFSERNRQKGKTGTCADDFSEQTIFMNDIDNKFKEYPIETPAHVVEVLNSYHLPVAFAYPTFNSSEKLERFRFALVCDETITDGKERESIQGALIKCFPQSDKDCINADRIFFGTNKGIYKEIGDITAVCKKADLLAFAQAVHAAHEEKAEEKPKFGQTNVTKETTTTGKFWNGFKQWCRDCNLAYTPGKQEFRRELAAIADVTEKELDKHTKDGNYYPYVIKAEILKELFPWEVPPLS